MLVGIESTGTLFFKKKFFLILLNLERERKRRRERERETTTHCSSHPCIHWSSPVCALGIEPTTLAHQDDTLTIWTTHPGQELLFIADENIKWYSPLWKTVWQFLMKLSIALPYDSTVVLHDISPNGLKICPHIKSAHKCV